MRLNTTHREECWPLRFGTRTLFVIIFACSSIFARYAWRASTQRQIVNALVSKGATVHYGESLDREVAVPKALRWLLDADLYANVTEVDLSFEKTLPPSDIEALSGLDSLDCLTIRSRRDQDEGGLYALVRLDAVVCNCSHLERLILNGCSTRNNLATLTQLKYLKILSLTDTDTSDSDLAKIAKMSSLEYLYLDGTWVTEEGVASLKAKRPQLEVYWAAHVD